ncbi:hypothetical protein [Paracoccus denitrificans]|uniref:hypothetical protein n=1 Tax=Paracoccus denitrificans TaxID=266 RepID=UPI00131A1F84|nr:hypothetical protein [Paracoccus denitrificans]
MSHLRRTFSLSKRNKDKDKDVVVVGPVDDGKPPFHDKIPQLVAFGEKTCAKDLLLKKRQGNSGIAGMHLWISL